MTVTHGDWIELSSRPPNVNLIGQHIEILRNPGPWLLIRTSGRRLLMWESYRVLLVTLSKRFLKGRRSFLQVSGHNNNYIRVWIVWRGHNRLLIRQMLLWPRLKKSPLISVDSVVPQILTTLFTHLIRACQSTLGQTQPS